MQIVFSIVKELHSYKLKMLQGCKKCKEYALKSDDGSCFELALSFVDIKENLFQIKEQTDTNEREGKIFFPFSKRKRVALLLTVWSQVCYSIPCLMEFIQI